MLGVVCCPCVWPTLLSAMIYFPIGCLSGQPLLYSHWTGSVFLCQPLWTGLCVCVRVTLDGSVCFCVGVTLDGFCVFLCGSHSGRVLCFCVRITLDGSVCFCVRVTLDGFCVFLCGRHTGSVFGLVLNAEFHAPQRPEKSSPEECSGAGPCALNGWSLGELWVICSLRSRTFSPNAVFCSLVFLFGWEKPIYLSSPPSSSVTALAPQILARGTPSKSWRVVCHLLLGFAGFPGTLCVQNTGADLKHSYFYYIHYY